MRVARALGLAASLAVLAVSVAGAENPPRPTGGLAFGPATLVDPLRPLVSPTLAVDGSGTLWVTGRPSGLVRSTDDGDSFRAVTPPPVGDGEADVAVDAAGAVYVATAGASGVSVASSADGGKTWRHGTVPALGPASRPWLAAGDADVYLAVTMRGGTEVLAARTSELAFRHAGELDGPESSSTRCGRLVLDRVARKLYLACARGNVLELVTGRAATVPGDGPVPEDGIVFTTSVVAVSPVGAVAGPLPSLAVDAGGGLLAAWIDAGDRNLYVAAPGGAPVLVNGAGAETAALPVVAGGGPGVFGVAFVATTEERDPNVLPDPRSDPRGAAAVRWYGFASLISGAEGSAPAIAQQRVTAKPVHFGRLCTACATDPVLGGTIGAALEPRTGALRAVFPDASGAEHVAHGALSRQLGGPTATGQAVSRPPPANGVVDGAGDAPGTPQLDLTKLELRQLNPSTLRVRMSVASTAALAPPPGSATGVWLTRFQILSRGQAGEAAYRSLYAAAISAAGAPLRFAAGEILCADACRPSSARPATGRVEGNAVVVDVNLAALSASVPLEGDLLYNVSGFTFGGDAGGTPEVVVDSLASFDYRLDQRIGPTTGRGRRITLRGTIRGGGAATVDVFENRTGRVSFRDARARLSFRSTRITQVRVRGRTATISGLGVNGVRRSSFVATVVDRGVGRLDSFGLRLSSGYRRSGRLTSGNAQIRGTG
jgi:hypothetical protein